MSFLRRTLDVTITLNTGQFADGSDSVTIKNHRINAFIQQPAGESQGICNCAIWGLSFDLMNRLTSIGVTAIENRQNIIQIEAGTIDKDGKEDKHIAYKGTITQAWADFSNQPEAIMQFVAIGAVSMSLKPVEPTSFKGQVPIDAVMQSLATEAGYTLVNKGVQGNITDPYLDRTTLWKIQALARAGSFQYTIDDSNKTITISPVNTGIRDDIIKISPKTGMVGYPTFCQNGIIVRTVYNKLIKSNNIIELESSIPAANGEFMALDIYHNLEAENPAGNGQWFTTFRAFREAGA